MTNHHDVGSGILEHGTHLSIIDATGLTAWRTENVDALVVESDVAQSIDVVLSEVADKLIRTCYRNGQTTLV